ncbi:MAG TPA: hypothetical protein GXX29_06120 [Firmicutes bacterium]|nr:hypothetical protein [Bacillota bacterium]
MAWCQLHYRNRILGKTEPVALLLPESRHKGPFPVMYLLHGIGDSYLDWTRRTRLEVYAAGLPLIIVMPTTDWQSFYIDQPGGAASASAIAIDLVDYIDSRFQTIAQASHRAVCGLSMGGYGALHLAFQFPDRFGTAIAHSGALCFFHINVDGDDFQKAADKVNTSLLRDVTIRLTGNPRPQGGPFDLWAQAAGVPKEKRPKLRIDCGTSDRLLSFNREFHDYLNRLGYQHEYAENPGDHNWDYWDRYITDSLQFFMAQCR